MATSNTSSTSTGSTRPWRSPPLPRWETAPAAQLPGSLGHGAWDEVRSRRESFNEWDFTHDSAFVRPSPALAAFVERVGVKPADDPLESMLLLSDSLFHALRYVAGSTSASSPIDDILESGERVCQDYAHVMIAIARVMGSTRPVCFRLLICHRSEWWASSGRRQSRLGGMLVPRTRLDRLRSHQPLPG